MTPESINLQLAKVPFFRFLDFKITEYDDGTVAAVLPFADRLVGNSVKEYYHGGIIASFMEAVASIAVSFAPLPPPKPVNVTVDYLRPGVRGPLMGRATISRKGKRLASVRTVSWQDDESRPVAEGLYHFLMV